MNTHDETKQETGVATEHEQNKNNVIKTLAIVGLLALTVLAVWGSVQIVRVLPAAFSSLASVAETVYGPNRGDTLVIVTDKTVSNTGEPLHISWNKPAMAGVYHFSYACVPGVSVDIETTNDTITGATCKSEIALPEGETSLTLTAYSERRRFVDIPFTIAFRPADETRGRIEQDGSVTVVNARIPQSTEVAIENGEDVATSSEENGDKQGGTAEADDETPNTPNGTPTPTDEVISYFPESHENGFTDLKVTYRGVGQLTDGVFVPTASLTKNSRGAFRFKVKNIGTKTSKQWAFDATLPTGATFESQKQEGLRPNEHAVYTLGFELSEVTGTREIGATVTAPEDARSANDTFQWSVEVR